MSRRLVQAHVAVTNEGDVLLNVATLDCERSLEAVVKEAQKQRGAVFIGIALTKPEVHQMINELRMIVGDVTAHTAGKRIWRQRRRRQRPLRR